MAANPLPPQDGPRRNVPATAPVNTGRRWWPPVLAVITIAVIAFLIWWLASGPPRTNPQRTVAGSSGNATVQLTNLSTTTPTANGAVDVTGTITNQAKAPITGVTVDATFRNITGKDLETVSAQLEPSAGNVAPPKGSPAGTAREPNATQQTHGFKNPGGSAGEQAGGHGVEANGGSSAPGFSADPIQPGQSREFVIHFRRLPEGWRGGVPDLKVTNVQAGQ